MYQLDYWRDFVKSYPGKSKFSFTWNTYMSHDDVNKLNKINNYFANLLKDLHPYLKNSYLMIMADHGSRYNDFRATKSGHREDNNPVFILSIPESSESTVFNNLRGNRKKLITGFDIHATLNHILENGPSTKRGISLLSPIPIRTCQDLQIPPYFCICETISMQFFDKILVSQLVNFLVSCLCCFGKTAFIL